MNEICEIGGGLVGKFVDLTGRIFGQLTVLERVKLQGEHESHWKCRCTCGNETVVIAGNLKKGQTQSCGCTASKRAHINRIIDITGQKFGKLTVLYPSDKNGNNDTIWHCKCDCGNECDVGGKNLRSGHTTSCGCRRSEAMSETFFKDLSGQTFGYLTAIEPIGRSGACVLWKCLCKCGQYAEVISSSLIHCFTTSCGCRRISYGEEQICKILDDNKINYLYNKGYFKDLLGIDGLPLRYDFILLQNGNKPYRLIEFDGLQHDLPVKYFGGEEKFLKQKENDRRKNVYAQSHNIPLVRIPYSKRDTMTLNDLIGDKYLIKGEM